MAEPDFEQIARMLIERVDSDYFYDAKPGPFPIGDDQATAALLLDVIAQLRQVWNARGAADAHIISSYGYTEHLTDELRKLDR